MPTPWRWRLYDPTTDVEVVFPLNPNEGALPQLAKQITETPTTAGRTLIFEGVQTQAPRFPMSGSILTEEHYDFMRTWYATSRQLQLTDDLDQVFWVYLISFSPKRRRATNHKWSMTFDAEAIILDWPAP